MKPKIYNRWEKRPTIAAPSGSKEEPTYEIQIDKHGAKNLVQTGKTNIYEAIQSYLEETKIENIIRRATLGDTEALKARAGAYMDVDEIPTNWAEIQNRIIQLETEFSKLSLEQRAAFNHDPGQYIAEIGTESWAQKMGRMTENAAAAQQEDTAQ